MLIRFAPRRSGKEVASPPPPPENRTGKFPRIRLKPGTTHWSQHAVVPIGLGANLYVTTAVPATEMIHDGGGSCTSKDRYDPADRSALLPTPVG